MEYKNFNKKEKNYIDGTLFEIKALRRECESSVITYIMSKDLVSTHEENEVEFEASMASNIKNLLNIIDGNINVLKDKIASFKEFMKAFSVEGKILILLDANHATYVPIEELEKVLKKIDETNYHLVEDKEIRNIIFECAKNRYNNCYRIKD